MRAKIGNLELEIENENDLKMLSAFASNKGQEKPAFEPAVEKPKVKQYKKKKHKKVWTNEEDLILLHNPLNKAKRLLKRSSNAIYMRRMALKKKGIGIPDFQNHSSRKHQVWTPDEDKIALNLPVKVAAKKLGRTKAAVAMRKSFLNRN